MKSYSEWWSSIFGVHYQLIQCLQQKTDLFTKQMDRDFARTNQNTPFTQTIQKRTCRNELSKTAWFYPRLWTVGDTFTGMTKSHFYYFWRGSKVYRNKRKLIQIQRRIWTTIYGDCSKVAKMVEKILTDKRWEKSVIFFIFVVSEVMQPIYVTKSFLPNIELYKNKIDAIWESWWLTNYWPQEKELTQRLREYFWVEYLLLVSNATVWGLILYKALWITKKVITTPFSFVASTSSLVWWWLEPIFVDIDQYSWNIDCKKIQKIKNNSEISCIAPVHVFWNPCDIEAIENIAQENDRKTIYDASHCFDIQYKNKSILSYGDACWMSLHATKLFHTVEWGILTFKKEEDYIKAKNMINFGIDSNLEITEIWINAKMSDFHASMWLCMLESMDDIRKKRENLWNYYQKTLWWISWIIFQQWNSFASHNHHYFPVVFPSEKILLSIIDDLKKNNINPRRYFYPSLNTLPYLSYQSMPISEDISTKILCLPFYPDLWEEIVDTIVEIIKKYLS